MTPRTGAALGSVPRRARHLIPAGLPRRGELLAVCAVTIVVTHLLLAQLTLVLAVAFAMVSKASRWRLSWLLAPGAAGLAWTLAIGPDKALAGFAAGPASILWHLSGGHPAGESGHLFAGFGDVRHWLPGQFPVALICGAAEAALAGWLDWLHTDEWAVPPPRPGLIAAARGALAAAAVRAGAVVTRDGCALGVVPSTGAAAELRWADLARGALVAGGAQRDVTLTGLQVVHAALRRRKPVIVLDAGDAVIARAVAAACQATGTPLLANPVPKDAGRAVQVAVAGNLGAESASQLWGRSSARQPEPADLAASGLADPADRQALDLGRVVRERLAALLPADAAELASRACGDLAALAADLRRIGADGDALVWVPYGERAPAHALAALLRDSTEAGMSVLIGTTSPEAAVELGELAGTTLVYRVTDRDLAASLAARTGTWLLPATTAAALAGHRPGDDPGPTPPVGDLVPSPVIPAATLLALGQAEFVLAASAPRRRLIVTGRMVPARLPGRSR